MNIYLVKQLRVNRTNKRVAAVKAKSVDEAIDKANTQYGGEWVTLMYPAAQISVSDMLEESHTDTMLLNI
jgi:hypothetical protein